MKKGNSEGLQYYQFETLQLPGVIQAVFSRHGGVSPVPWKSLNIGGTVGDDPGRVAENLSRIVESMQYKLDDLVQVIHAGQFA